MLIRTLLSTAALAMVAQPAMAQVSLPNKWDSEYRKFIIDTHIPQGCDNPTVNAAQTLRDANPAMQIMFDFAANPDGGPDSTSVIGRRSYGYGWQTTVGTTPKAYTGPGLFESYGQLVDADIYMNHDLIYWPATTDTEQSYDLWCGTGTQGTFLNTQVDYQSAILHELGHAVGFSHRTDTTSGACVMHEQQARGKFNRILCSDERAAYQAAY